MRTRGFSLLELLATLMLTALLLGLGAGAYLRFRSSTQLTQASQRLASELQAAQQMARSSGQVQLRQGLEVALAPLTEVVVKEQWGVPEGRLLEGSSSLGLRGVKKFLFLEDSLVQFTLSASNFADLPMEEADTGFTVEIGLSPQSAPFQRLFTIPFYPDGTVALAADSGPGRIVLSNGSGRRQVEISRLGKVKESKLE